MSLHDRRQALERGARAERVVADALEADGWSIRSRNWRGGGGELDLVVQRRDVLRFVEVKARAPSDPTLEDAVTPGKQRKLTRAATAWMLENGTADECAFMVALVRFHDEGWSIDWIDDAFDAG